MTPHLQTPDGTSVSLKTTVTIGQDEICDVAIDDAKLEAVHARIEPGRRVPLLVPLATPSLMKLNGRTVTVAVGLKPTDVINVGGSRLLLTVKSADESSASLERPSARSWTLVADNGEQTVLKGDQTIGRGPDADIVVSAGQISRRHARLVTVAGVVFVEDLGSANGTYVNGERIWGSSRLDVDDDIVLDDVRFSLKSRADALLAPDVPEPVTPASSRDEAADGVAPDNETIVAPRHDRTIVAEPAALKTQPDVARAPPESQPLSDNAGNDRDSAPTTAPQAPVRESAGPAASEAATVVVPNAADGSPRSNLDQIRVGSDDDTPLPNSSFGSNNAVRADADTDLPKAGSLTHSADAEADVRGTDATIVASDDLDGDDTPVPVHEAIQPSDTANVAEAATRVTPSGGAPDTDLLSEVATRVAEVGRSRTTPKAFKLVGLARPYTAREWSLQPGRTTIGRAEDNDIVLTEPSVSMRHAQLLIQESATTVMNLESANGVFVNGKAAESADVQAGDVITIGRVELVFAERGSEVDIRRSLPGWVFMLVGFALAGSLFAAAVYLQWI